MTSPTGKRFSLVYLKPSQPLRDDIRFRRRLSVKAEEVLKNLSAQVPYFFKREAGINVPTYGSDVQIGKLFEKGELRDVLDSITLVHEYLVRVSAAKLARQWLQFVAGVLVDESVGYRVDEQCGVHHYIDEEFERSRSSTLAALGDGSLAAARAAFEDAHRHLDSPAPDTKASIRSAFESLEIVARLSVLVPRT